MAERTCNVVGCTGAVHGRGLCMRHYQAERRRQGGFRERVYDMSGRPARGVCEVAGCGRPTKARGLCNRHYVAATRAGGLGADAQAD